jgi:hypothetical protein
MVITFEQEWLEQMESTDKPSNWEDLKEKIPERISHSYGDEPTP